MKKSEELTSMDQIRETFEMLLNRRIAQLYPLFCVASMNLAIFASTFVPLLQDTMVKPSQKSWDEDTRTSKAILTMVGLGIGEILGALIFGKATDILSKPKIVGANLLAFTISFIFMALYTFLY